MVVYQKVIRAFDVVKSIEIYRIVGRRPSQVFVDAKHQISEAGPETQPLKEFVYWRTTAEPGDSIQERVGGILVVMPNGDSHPVTLSLPEPLAPQTAFLHAQTVRTADMSRIDSLIASGELVEVYGRKSNKPSSNPGTNLMAADHALVVESRPPALDDAPAYPKGRGGFRRF